jgi:hypothetical protein
MGLFEVLLLVLVVLWLTGNFAFPAVAGSAIHVLLLIVVILLLARWARGRSL